MKFSYGNIFFWAQIQNNYCRWLIINKYITINFYNIAAPKVTKKAAKKAVKKPAKKAAKKAGAKKAAKPKKAAKKWA